MDQKRNVMLEACRQGDVDTVRRLITNRSVAVNANLYPDTARTDGSTPLNVACENRHTNTVRFLLSLPECQVNCTYNGKTPLHIVCSRGYNTIVALLLAREDCDPNVQTRTGDTPLHLATQRADTIIQLLLADPQCEPNVTNNRGVTPLHIACMKGNAIVVKALLETGKCDPNVQTKYTGDTPLHLATRNKDTQIIQLLLDHPQCDLSVANSQGETPLQIALWLNKVNIFILILERGCHETYANRDQMLTEASSLVQQANGDSLLHMACERGSTTIIQLLLADPQCEPNVTNNQGVTPLHVACMKKNAIVVKALLETGKCDPNVQTKYTGDTPLYLATQNKDTQIIQLLLDHPQCDLSVANNQGETILHVACEKGNVAIVKTLLETGKCDPNVQTSTVTGDTPLHLATQNQNTKIIQSLLADPQCEPNVTNNRGVTPLHVACEERNVAVVKTLLKTGKHDPNVQTNTGDTPLHLATRNEDTEIIQLLLADPQCDPNVANNQGETPLQIALKLNNVNIFIRILESGCHETYSNRDQMLTEASSLVQQATGRNSLLHLACEYGSTTIVELIQLLLADPRCDPNVTNNQGETPLHVAYMKRHVGCWRRNIICIKTLLENGKCDPNVRTNTGDTPLHLAIQIMDIRITQLLLADPQCDSNVKNNQGETPLKLALRMNNIDIVILILERGCHETYANRDQMLTEASSLVQQTTGDSLLHVACEHGSTTIVECLLGSEQCDPNVPDSGGSTALHIAVEMECVNSEKLVECFLNSSYLANFNHQNINGDTALHVAVTLNKAAVVKLLVSDRHCNPNVRNRDGDTPLSIACKLNSVEIVTLLLSSGRVDPECVNNAGKTPTELATSYHIIHKISSFTESRHKHPIETFVKIFVIGNAETGKSTLIQAICTEATIIHKFISKQVKNVEPHTAGIIPKHFRSKHFGNTVLYDFAGQHEYYSSHAAVMENVAVPTPPAFVVVVAISEPIDKITEKLTYWWSFIENHCKRTSVLPPVILVGSHKDVVKARKENVEERMKQILQSLAGIPTTFNFAGDVAIDCRSLVSKGLDKLLSLLNETCRSLRKTSDVDLRCHVLYAFLSDKFQSSIACKVSELIFQIQGEDTLLPQNPAELERLLSTLSDKGQVLLLKNTSNPKDSWILLQREQLLSDVNGSIFAPDNFRQSIQGFAKSTGVVPRSKIEHQFPQYPLDIVVGFLSHLEFCFKIDDYPTLDMIAGEWEPQSPASPSDRDEEFCFKIDDYPTLDMIAGEWEPQSPASPSDRDEEFYFFPALVRVEYPTDVWKQDQAAMETQKPPTTSQCGWFYQCSLPHQLLTSRFLHVLILRLAFRFALAVDRHSDQSPVIRRRCSAWKHGIAWWDRNGIETVVEIGLQCRWVTVMMRCSPSMKVECIHRRTAVIGTILNTKEEFCPAVAMVQSLIHPQCLQYPLEERLREGIIRYSLKEVAGAVVEGTQYAVDEDGSNPIALVELLPFEPYFALGQAVITKLFSTTVTADTQITDRDLSRVAERTYEMFREANPSHDHNRHSPDNPIVHCMTLLKVIRDRGSGSFSVLEQELSQFSIFCGQNPLCLIQKNEKHHTEKINIRAGITTSPGVNPTPPSDQDTQMSDRPTMMELIRFRGRERRINIPEEISTNCYQFGILLLEDSTGARVKNIAETYRGTSPAFINMEVLQQWLEGKGKVQVTWQALVEVLHDVGLTNLAADIEAVKR